MKPFVQLSAKKLELYEAPNSPSVGPKVRYYHRCFYKQKLRTTEWGFPFVWDFYMRMQSLPGPQGAWFEASSVQSYSIHIVFGYS